MYSDRKEFEKLTNAQNYDKFMTDEELEKNIPVMIFLSVAFFSLAVKVIFF